MSNSIQYDPFLARYLALELDGRLRGRGCAAAPFFAPDLSVILPLDRGEELRIDLHPSRGWVRVQPAAEPADAEPDAVCVGVSAPADERTIQIDLDVVGRFRDQARRLVLELQTNQWNALIVDRQSQAIVNVLRGRRAGSRSLFPGQLYEPPPRGARHGIGPVSREAARRRWEVEMDAAPPEKRRSALLASFAWTGSFNADWILRAGTGEEAFARWWWLRSLPAATPGTVEAGRTRQPYPVRLDGLPWTAAPSLLAAMEAAALPIEPSSAGPEQPQIEARIQARIGATERKLDRLRAELSSASGEAARMRSWGDLLLAKLHLVPRGEASVRLLDWEEREVDIPLDPELSPPENAARLYDLARRKKRAEERLPALIETGTRELTKWRDALEGVARGLVPESIEEELRRASESKAAGGEQGAPLPYRVYRTSGGLEVRVGRSSKENDRLTFRESSPNDVWLHARSVPGSHVILRWPDAVGSPPARDLEEAAQLAALFSRARTSSLVAVDWTRRKHVRKPRGAAPGLVVPQRVKTLFVEPLPEVAERLAAEG